MEKPPNMPRINGKAPKFKPQKTFWVHPCAESRGKLVIRAFSPKRLVDRSENYKESWAEWVYPVTVVTSLVEGCPGRFWDPIHLWQSQWLEENGDVVRPTTWFWSITVWISRSLFSDRHVNLNQDSIMIIISCWLLDTQLKILLAADYPLFGFTFRCGQFKSNW